VIYSGHWDHLGIGLPDAKGDKIYNGAVDNATGIAALLELARAYAAAPAPQRSVVFLAVTAEEKGLLGSEYYAANPVYPLAKTVGVINMDALSPYGPSRDFTISGSAKLDLLDQLVAKAKQANAELLGRSEAGSGPLLPFRPLPVRQARRAGDLLRFGRGLGAGRRRRGQGEPRTATRRELPPAGRRMDREWTFTGMARDLGMLYAVGRDLADSKAWPNWSKDSEFRAARDRAHRERGQVPTLRLTIP
jgi:Zn-dependent M28 family amino/carboxypeptidase